MSNSLGANFTKKHISTKSFISYREARRRRDEKMFFYGLFSGLLLASFILKMMS